MIASMASFLGGSGGGGGGRIHLSNPGIFPRPVSLEEAAVVVGSQLRVASSSWTLARLYGLSPSAGGGVSSRTGSLSPSLNCDQHKSSSRGVCVCDLQWPTVSGYGSLFLESPIPPGAT